MKATDHEQYFPVVLFIMLYKVVLAFESVDENLKCDHSNKSYGAVLSCGTVYCYLRLFLLLWMKSQGWKLALAHLPRQVSKLHGQVQTVDFLHFQSHSPNGECCQY